MRAAVHTLDLQVLLRVAEGVVPMAAVHLQVATGMLQFTINYLLQASAL